MSSRDLIQEASDRVRTVRADPTAEWPAGTLEQADAWLHEALAGMPDTPPPPPAPQFAWPLAAGALYGRTKWLPGSLGCDLFVPDGSLIYAMFDGVIDEVLGGSGLQGGDEFIYATPDRQLAARCRHSVCHFGTGTTVARGDTIGIVWDPSLALLGRVPAWFPAPDEWAHLDLSLAFATDQFSPEGGGGGNASAFAFVQATGYQGTVWNRTPGPPDAVRP